MIWKRWHLWNFILRHLALSQGFLDPITVFSNLQRFSKPSEVWAPTELLRSGMILQARGLMNSQAIQHNLDWIWPYWVRCQFDPQDVAFIPRAFNLTHINLTHRNWTAVGLPGLDEYPLVDPRGLVTPFFDGWSIDAWVLGKQGHHLIPAHQTKATQEIKTNQMLAILTGTENHGTILLSGVEVLVQNEIPICRISLEASVKNSAYLVVSIRPYNPEGVSFIDNIKRLPYDRGWLINGKQEVHLEHPPEWYVFSNYSEGDVFSHIFDPRKNEERVDCAVGMATAAAVYPIEVDHTKKLNIDVPLMAADKKTTVTLGRWDNEALEKQKLQIPDQKYQFLYETALKTLVLHSPGEVYPGPYTYKRFWFRDAAFILNAMLSVGMTERVEKVLDKFHSRQLPTGYFLSQDGEWDSNGEALWILHRYCCVTHQKPKMAWMPMIRQAARWIKRKRTAQVSGVLHSGLLPAGFSAEHLGPNDFYYWDDFWGVAGLRAAAYMLLSVGEEKLGKEFLEEADDFSRCIDRSVSEIADRFGHQALPASPYRRMDAGAIGSLAAGYPLQLWDASDVRLLETATYLLKNCFVHGGFYQEISHSGVNAYLTLHVAQIFLRAGDPRYKEIAQAIADLASPTGQWPEAIHPRTGGGCMGDGQHVWAAAEWVLFIQNLFVREEESKKKLILCQGIPEEWTKKEGEIFFGPTMTSFGNISVTIEGGKKPKVSWKADWHTDAPEVEVQLPGHPGVNA